MKFTAEDAEDAEDQVTFGRPDAKRQLIHLRTSALARVSANGRPRHPNAAAALGAPPLARGGVTRDKRLSPSTSRGPRRAVCARWGGGAGLVADRPRVPADSERWI
jgi:hypothetical protein